MARNRKLSNRVKRVAKEVVEVVADLFSESTPADESFEADLDEEFDSDEGSADEQGTCVLQFGLDALPIEVESPPQTIRQAFALHSEELNLNPERPATYKVNNQLIDGNEVVQVGELYVANVTGEKKG
jgi:hypothetical protein